MPDKKKGRLMTMANRIMLNETSYHGAGAIQEIATEAKTRELTRKRLCARIRI